MDLSYIIFVKQTNKKQKNLTRTSIDLFDDCEEKFNANKLNSYDVNRFILLENLLEYDGIATRLFLMRFTC